MVTSIALVNLGYWSINKISCLMPDLFLENGPSMCIAESLSGTAPGNRHNFSNDGFPFLAQRITDSLLTLYIHH